MSLKHGAKQVNEIEVVAPRGFELDGHDVETKDEVYPLALQM